MLTGGATGGFGGATPTEIYEPALHSADSALFEFTLQTWWWHIIKNQ